MRSSRLGIAVDDLGVGPKRGLSQAVELGYRTVELGASDGEIDPASLSHTGVRHLRHTVDALGLDLAVLSGPGGGGGLSDPAGADRRIDKTRQVLELAAKLGVPSVTVYLGRFSGEAKDGRRDLAAEALAFLGEHADKTGRILAVQAGDVPPHVLHDLFKELNCPTLRMCYDPGMLLMHGHEPMAELGNLVDRIAVSHLRDATAGSPRAAGREVRMGTGQIRFAEYLAALEQGHFSGPQIVRRGEAGDPAAEMAQAREFLSRYLLP